MEGKQMECVHCGETGFNRVIVDLEPGGDIGALCGNCEHDLYGEVLEQPLWQAEEDCIFCAEEGAFAFPLLECHIEREHKEDIIEYQIDESTPILCSTHARNLHPALKETPEKPAQIL